MTVYLSIVNFVIDVKRKNATSINLSVQQHSEYESAVNYQIRICLNETEDASCQHNLSTDYPILEETIDDLMCNQTYYVLIVWISADMTECYLSEARDVMPDCSGLNIIMQLTNYTALLITLSI